MGEDIIASWVTSGRELKKFYHWQRRKRKTNMRAWLQSIGAFVGVGLLKTNIVVITSTGVYINGKFRSFRSESRELRAVEIIDEANPKVLAITYCSRSGKRNAASEIRVPIPKGRLGEAVRLLSLLEK